VNYLVVAAQREEAEAGLPSWNMSRAKQRPAQGFTAEALHHKCKITSQQDQGAGTHYIHAEKHP